QPILLIFADSQPDSRLWIPAQYGGQPFDVTALQSRSFHLALARIGAMRRPIEQFFGRVAGMAFPVGRNRQALLLQHDRQFFEKAARSDDRRQSQLKRPPEYPGGLIIIAVISTPDRVAFMKQGEHPFV